jgi:transcriptional regulator with XRE-family HTH domain
VASIPSPRASAELRAGDGLTLGLYASYAYGMKSLGERIKELRDAADLSLRDLGKQAGGLSPVFLSDIELGRRFPSEEALTHIARALNTTLADLRKYDTRPPIEEMKRRTAENPALGVAFRKIVDLPQEELLRIANRGVKKK